MDRRGGTRKGAGRPRGPNYKPPKMKLVPAITPVKSTRLAQLDDQILALSEGLKPLEYMLGILRDTTDQTITRAERMDAAKSAAPYMHPRLIATENTNINRVVVHVVIEKDDAALL